MKLTRKEQIGYSQAILLGMLITIGAGPCEFKPVAKKTADTQSQTQPPPQPPGPPERALIQGLALGTNHSCALVNGGVWCWGDNRNGQLGIGDRDPRDVPYQVEGLKEGVDAIAAGGDTTCAIKGNDTFCWGNVPAEPGNVPAEPGNVRAEPGNVRAEPGNVRAEPGNVRAEPEDVRAEPGNVRANARREVVPQLRPLEIQSPPDGVDSIVIGKAHICLTSRSEKQVMCFGWYGEPPQDEPEDPLHQNRGLPADVMAVGHAFQLPAQPPGGVPVPNNGAPANPVQPPNERFPWAADVIASGDHHTCGFSLIENRLRCRGINNFGQFGLLPNERDGLNWDQDARLVNHRVHTLHAVAAGAKHTCILLGGGVQCIGNNENGQVGVNATTHNTQRGFYRVLSLGSFVAGVDRIAAGGNFTCARQHGKVKCWGSNSSGQLGRVAPADAANPTPEVVQGLDNSPTLIAAGSEHACAAGNGRILCWGNGNHGQLGAGAQVPAPRGADGNRTSTTPVEVTFPQTP